jgi:hypothetical protein
MAEQWLMILLASLSLLFAYLSWKFIESPFRAKSKISSKRILHLSITGILAFTFIGLYGHLNWKEINSGYFNPYHKLKNVNMGKYEADNKFLQQQSWDILRDLSQNNTNSVSGNNFDYELWYDDNSQKNKVLVVGNSHSKDVFNILYQSSVFSQSYQVARFGEQIRNLNSSHDFWQSKNYLAADTIMIATRYNFNDIKSLPSLIRKMQSDGKEVLLVLNIFEFPGVASSYNLVDKLVLNNLGVALDTLSVKINRSYFDYFKSSSQNRSSRINEYLSEIANDFGISTLNRMDYVCDMELEQCFAVGVDLSKNFYDYGHHTLDGTRYFSQQARLDKFLKPLFDKFNEE